MELNRLSSRLMQALLVPCSTNPPAGQDIAYSDIYQPVMDFFRQDDELSQGHWTSLKKGTTRTQAIECCMNALETQSKDLQLLVWLTVLLSQEYGVDGAVVGITALNTWCEHFWTNGFPLIEEGKGQDYQERFAKLHWCDRELCVLLPQVLTQAPAETVADTASIAALVNGLQRLKQLVSELTGTEAVIFCRVSDTLAPYLQQGTAAEPAAISRLPASVPSRSLPSAARDAGIRFQSRTEAIHALTALHAYFAANEPYGPVAPMLKRALDWAKQPVDEWLKALLQDDASKQKARDILGIHVP